MNRAMTLTALAPNDKQTANSESRPAIDFALLAMLPPAEHRRRGHERHCRIRTTGEETGRLRVAAGIALAVRTHAATDHHVSLEPVVGVTTIGELPSDLRRHAHRRRRMRGRNGDRRRIRRAGYNRCCHWRDRGERSECCTRGADRIMMTGGDSCRVPTALGGSRAGDARQLLQLGDEAHALIRSRRAGQIEPGLRPLRGRGRFGRRHILPVAGRKGRSEGNGCNDEVRAHGDPHS